jgi:peptide-methionine (S)-S-oxide reductase
MVRSSVIKGFVLAAVFVGLVRLVAFPGSSEAKSPAVVPPPTMDAPLASEHGEQTVVFSGGCFWGVQAVYQHVKGVISATSGYAGGNANSADYETVSSGRTNHAESVKVVFDPAQVAYGQLLHVFFSVAHDPTELNRQGPDDGPQYRSMISYTTDEQQKITAAYIAQLQDAHVFKHKIVTQLVPLKGFYPAEAYHQNYATIHPNNAYIVYNDAPKVENLKKEFGNLYREAPQLVAVK